MNRRFTGNSSQAYLSQASKRLHKRIDDLKNGKLKQNKDVYDYMVLNPELVDDIMNKIK